MKDLLTREREREREAIAERTNPTVGPANDPDVARLVRIVNILREWKPVLGLCSWSGQLDPDHGHEGRLTTAAVALAEHRDSNTARGDGPKRR